VQEMTRMRSTREAQALREPGDSKADQMLMPSVLMRYVQPTDAAEPR